MTFAVDIRHWPTVAAFEAHLAQHDPRICTWVQGLTLHHTYVPTVAQWRGELSMGGLLRYYRDEVPWVDSQGHLRRGWSAGPQLFIAPDGIWQLTPLHLPGVHAKAFNATHWGVEVVGFYDHAGWAEPIRALVFGAITALLRWRGLGASVINGHRDDPTTRKTCPGRAINLTAVRAEVARRLLTAPAPAASDQYTADSLILHDHRAAARQLATRLANAMLRQPTPRYTRNDVELVIVPAYADLCARVGMDATIPIAQMALETGYLSSDGAARPYRNPAGIGGSGTAMQFATWADDAIPAHVGRLLAYALPTGTGTPAQQSLIAKALRYRDLPAKVRGSAQTLRQLGQAHNPSNLGWAAPGTKYGQSIARIANELGA